MKILVIRFSSFGDVLQSLSIVGRLGEAWPNSEIHFVTRAEFVPLVEKHPHLTTVWSLRRGAGLFDLIMLTFKLRRQHFTHIYDAHNNLRSHLLTFLINGLFSWRTWAGKRKFLRRPIYRWKRFVLFNFRRNLFPQPFSGQFALLEPLRHWGVSIEAPQVPQLFLGPLPPELSDVIPTEFNNFVALAPSAAFMLKRWPLEHWRRLIELAPDVKFVILGGPDDSFLAQLEKPGSVLNLAGRLSLLESSHIVACSKLLIANDTGLMHVAEQLGVPCLALMGPAPFGFPSRPRTHILELNLSCRPCSKHGQGPCTNPEFQKCLRDIAPGHVAQAMRRVIHAQVVAPVS